MDDKSLSTCLDLYGVTELQQGIDYAAAEGYNYVSINVVYPPQEGDSDDIVRGRSPYDTGTSVFQTAVQCRVAPDLDLDTTDVKARKRNTRIFVRDIEYSVFLGVQVVHFDLPAEHSNLACTLLNTLSSLENSQTAPQFWVNVLLSGPPEDEFEPFRRWQNFRESCDNNCRLWVALVIPEDIPDQSKEIVDLWMAEQVGALVTPCNLFLMNSSQFPVLSKAHQAIVKRLMGLHPVAMVSSPTESRRPHLYADYLKHMFANRVHVGPLQEEFTLGYQDTLQIPLQPLADHLESSTYEVFEKDPVKYMKYREAIKAAFIDRKKEFDVDKKPLVVMVVGAGRGPLVTACLESAKEIQIDIKMYAVEKNPNAVNVLNHLNTRIWGGVVTVVSSDMRSYTPADKADILVSELLGSWGDNELSPECLDGAQKFLKPDGISIPSSYTSYINPIQCPLLHRQAGELQDMYKPKDHQHQTTYVVYYRHVNHLDSPKPLFTFNHPVAEIGKNDRHQEVTFVANNSCIIHGFAGYFDCVLYKDVTISILPETHTYQMNSWFSMFIPIKTPMEVQKGETIRAVFWRKSSSTHVWYEWSVIKPRQTIIHNIGGKCSSIGLSI